MGEDEERKFRARRVVGLERDPEPARRRAVPEDADGVESETEPQEQAAEPVSRDYGHLDEARDRGFGEGSRRAVAAAALSALMFVLLFMLPWAYQEGTSLSRSEVRQGPFDAAIGYLAGLTTMPVWGLLLATLAALVILTADLRTRTRGQHALTVLPAAALGLYGAFLVLLAAARILGYWFAQVLDADEALFQPHVVPWLMLLVSAGLGYVFVQRLRSGWDVFARIGTDRVALAAERWARRTVLVAAGALAALPLLPLASDFGDGAHHVSEAGYYASTGPFSFVGESVERVVSDLNLIHLMLWLTILVAVATLVVAAIERLGWIDARVRDPLLQGFLLNVVFWIVILVTTILLYTTHIPNSQFFQFRAFADESYAPALNHVLPIALLLLGWTIGKFVMGVTVPFARGVASARPSAETATNDGS